jgi:LmbE family N-acetylglucosaminyl deacetylase
MDYIPERAVVIVAHADDIEFGCAGTIARWTRQGAQVTYVLVTDSSAGSNEPGVLRRDLVATRQREKREAAQLCGVDDVRFLGHPDGELVATLDLRRDLTRIIRDVRPNVVITMDPTMIFSARRDYVNHPDHRAVGEAAMYATFPSAGSRPIFKELLVEGYEPHEVEMLWFMLTNDAEHKIDISSVIETKRAALAIHQSQLSG